MAAETCKNVMIIEDDQAIRASLRDIITFEGYSTIEAENGRVALNLLFDENVPTPCLILLDLMMPVLNGWEFLKIRQQNGSIAHIPTVVISAVSDARVAIGPTKTLKKPLNVEELVHALQSYCS